MADILLFPISLILFLLDLPGFIIRHIRLNTSIIKLGLAATFPDFPQEPTREVEKKSKVYPDHYIYVNPQSW